MIERVKYMNDFFIQGKDKIFVYSDFPYKYKIINFISLCCGKSKPFKIKKMLDIPFLSMKENLKYLPEDERKKYSLEKSVLFTCDGYIYSFVMRIFFKLLKLRNITLNKKRKVCLDGDILIYDKMFPKENSGFRYAEFDAYFNHFDHINAITTLEDIKFTSTVDNEENRQKIVNTYNEKLGKQKVFYDKGYKFNTKNSKLLYCVFLGIIYRVLVKEKIKVPFVFTLYPGGWFGLDVPESDRMLKKVMKSPYFRKVIVTQQCTYDYLLYKRFCPKEKIEFIFGGVVDPKLFKKDFSIGKKFFGRDKNTLDICFVATRYSERGKDKGYDVFVAVAKILSKKYSNIHFHVVGKGFDEDTIDVSSIADRITFYGFMDTLAFEQFYLDKDIILSPNRAFVLAPGFFDGFPTGCVVEAQIHDVAAFLTDPLDLNQGHYINHEDVEFINTNPKDVSALIEKYYKKPDLLPKLAENGMKKTLYYNSPENQILPRIKILEDVLAKEKKGKKK